MRVSSSPIATGSSIAIRNPAFKGRTAGVGVLIAAPTRFRSRLDFILNVKHEHPSWGDGKIRERSIRRFAGIPIPARSTNHALLDGHGFVERRARHCRPPALTDHASRFLLTSEALSSVDRSRLQERTHELLKRSLGAYALNWL